MHSLLHRIRRLAGLTEAYGSDTLLSRDETDDLDIGALNQRQDREAKIVGLILRAFKRVGIDLADGDDAVFYDEDAGREATVQLDAMEIASDDLLRLKQSGLSDRFVVQAGHVGLSVAFIVADALDHAV